MGCICRNIVTNLWWCPLDGDDYYYYISQDLIALGVEGGDDYEKIMTQQWIAHYPKGWVGLTEENWLPCTCPCTWYGGKWYPGKVSLRDLMNTNLNPANVSDAAKQYTGGGQSTDSPIRPYLVGCRIMLIRSIL